MGQWKFIIILEIGSQNEPGICFLRIPGYRSVCRHFLAGLILQAGIRRNVPCIPDFRILESFGERGTNIHCICLCLICPARLTSFWRAIPFPKSKRQ